MRMALIDSLGDLFNTGKSSSTAIVASNGLHLSYSDCRSIVQKIQSILGNEIGSPVTLMYPNCLEFVLAFAAITGIRRAASPLNPKYKYEEIKFYMEDCGSKILIISANELNSSPAVSVAKELGATVFTLDIDLESLALNLVKHYQGTRLTAAVSYSPDVALILHTSGTTSKPKGVPLTHKNICKTINNVIRTYQLTSDDRSMVVMPLFHVHGLIGSLLSSLGSGGSVFVTQFSANSFWQNFLKYDCTWYSAVPTIHQILLKLESDVGSSKKMGKLRFIRSCSSSLPPAVLRRLESTYGVPVLEAYAMTEASHQICSNSLVPLKYKPGSVGIPQGVDVMIINGEVCIRGDNVTLGYLNRPEANEECFIGGNWFRTGDQGRFDEEGFLFLTGRLKELINRGGEKISPLEIDNVVLELKEVSEAVTFGMPSDIYGEEIHVAVVLRPGSAINEDIMRQHCKKNLADFKVPSKFHIVSEIPKTPTGKVQRRFVADRFKKLSSKL